MKIEIFCLNDLSIKGEGNLHIIILNKRTGHIFRFPKETGERNRGSDGDTEIKPDLNVHKLYKIGVNYKKYNVLQKFWGKVYLPKIRVGLMPAKIIEDIARFVENSRAECRRHRSIAVKTSHVEILPDLTKFSTEYKDVVNGITLCVELKPKFGILFESRDPSGQDCLSRCARFCLSQMRKDEAKKTNYCPCDFFSGDPPRMKRAIRQLIANSQDKLRLFQDGQIISIINHETVTRSVRQLFQEPDCNNHNIVDLVDLFCNLVIQAVTHDKSECHEPVALPFNVSTSCHAHSWSTSEVDTPAKGANGIFSGSVLGRLIHTDCLVDYTAQEVKNVYDQFKEFLVSSNIEMNENIFDLWNEHLIPLDMPGNIRDIIRLLKKYMVSLTIRDCSLMIKFTKISRDQIDNLVTKDDNSFVLAQRGGGLLLTTIDIIDLSIKPLSKINYNFDLEQELKSFFDL